MKKLFALLLAMSIFVSCSIFVSADDPSEDDLHNYDRTDGTTFSLEDCTVYVSDLEDASFSNSQQVIDFIYNVGYNRAPVDLGGDRLEILGFKLTLTEMSLVINNPQHATILYSVYIKTKEAVISYYPNDEDIDDGCIGNAFQHAYWTFLLCKYSTLSFALDFVLAHEMYDTNDSFHRNMDEFNDRAAHNYFYENYASMMSKSDNELASSAYRMVLRGELKYIIFDYEYIYASYYYEATGKTVNYTRIGNFYSYTDEPVPLDVPAPLEYTVPAAPGQPGLRPNALIDESENE